MNVTDLVALRLLEEIGEKFVSSEPVVQLCMQPMWNTNHEEDPTPEAMSIRMWAHVVALIRTGGMFAFHYDDLPPQEIEPEGDLPPLPYNRMWIEVAGATKHRGVFPDLDGRRSLLFGYGLVEEVQGKAWRVFQVMGDIQIYHDNPTGRLIDAALIREYRILVDDKGIVCTIPHEDRAAYLAMPETHQILADTYQRAPVSLVQILHLLGVEPKAAAFPRQQTRHFERRHGFPVPTAYVVQIGSLGETHEPGRGDRVFTHRWIVRGHYRRDDGGKFHIAGKGQCAWVRPYVKGPEGAPWKGRPIYQVEGGTPSPPQP